MNKPLFILGLIVHLVSFVYIAQTYGAMTAMVVYGIVGAHWMLSSKP